MAAKDSSYSILAMFRYADWLDIILMILGLILAFGQGTCIPLGLYFYYSDILNTMMAYSPCFEAVREAMVELSSNSDPSQLSKEAKTLMNSSMYERIKDFPGLSSDQSLFDSIGAQCGYYALLGVAIIISGSLNIAFWSIAGERQIHRMRTRLFKAMLSKDAGWYDDRRAGELNNMLFANVRKVQAGIGSKVPITVSWIAVAISGFILAFYSDWLVTIVICSLVPVLFIIQVVMIKVVRIYSTKQTAAYGSAGAIANEVIGNIRTVLAFNRQEYEVQRYGGHLGESSKMAMVKTVSSGLAQGLTFLTINALAGLAFWWGSQ